VSKQQFFDISFFDAMIYFVPIFLVTALIMGQTVKPVSGVTNTASYEILQILMQIFVVSITEELFFRGFVQNYLGWVIQAPVFALFHLAAYTSIYGLNLYAFITALVMGLLFGYIVKVFSNKGQKSTGLAITWGLHAGWNVAIATGMFFLMGVL
jgi:membrane protease YdiL (CAAX protease family)